MLPDFLFKKTVSLGDGKPLQVFANYGAGFPVAVLYVTAIEDGWVELVDNTGKHVDYARESEILHHRAPGGSPIGYYWNSKHAL